MMKRYPYILKSISEFHVGKDGDSIQNEKFKSKQWFDWCDFINKTKNNSDLKLHGNSISQNMCYTAIVLCKGIKTVQLIQANRFCVQKSIVGDFVTFYGIVDTSILYEGDRLRHPKLMVVSPVGPFINLFDSAWNLIRENYPNCCYVPYRTLGIVPTEPEFQNKNIYELLFGYEGDLKTNIFGDRHYSPE